MRSVWDKKLVRLLFPVVGLAFPLATTQPLAAQAPQVRLAGFPVTAVAEQLDYEAALREVVDTARARRLSVLFSSEPHVAGSPRQRETAFIVDSIMRSFGLATVVDSYLVYLPHPRRLEVYRISPSPLALDVVEPGLAEDETTRGEVFPQFNAYTGRGDVTAEIVFANYGLIEDYEILDQAGVSVAGRIVVARYGRSYRGVKVREAERHGAVGLLLFSDPADDGYIRGDVYPEGPFRPEQGVQRGSVKNTTGDPSTPHGPSTFDAVRIPEGEMIGIAGIPVAPIGYGAAREILESLRGADLPLQGWQGGLPFRYHLGPGPVRVRLVVDTERGEDAYHTIYNTLAFVQGAVYPDEWVIVGAHRDAWGPGAIDNVSGIVSVLEAARAFAVLGASGRRPKRTLVFATWDAEEWGLIGSTEYVENNEQMLVDRVVAYLNQDSPATGPNFSGGASGALKTVIRDVARTVENRFANGTVYDAWAAAQEIGSHDETRIGDLGGGSDFVAFYNHLGIAAASYGFGGTAGGVYHSAYDTHRWMKTFADPNFLAHSAAAGFSASLGARLANAHILPLDHEGLASQLEGMVQNLGVDSGEDVSELSAAVRVFELAGAHLNSRIEMAVIEEPDRDWATVNSLMREVERAFTREEGLVGREWFRNLLFAADADNGYSNMPFPSINEALRAGDMELVRSEIARMVLHVEAAIGVIRDIIAHLSARPIRR